MSSLVRSSAKAMIPSGDKLAALQEDLAIRIWSDSIGVSHGSDWRKTSEETKIEFRLYAASALNYMRERIQREMDANDIDLVVERR